jgi:hypothetical protein
MQIVVGILTESNAGYVKGTLASRKTTLLQPSVFPFFIMHSLSWPNTDTDTDTNVFLPDNVLVDRKK